MTVEIIGSVVSTTVLVLGSVREVTMGGLALAACVLAATVVYDRTALAPRDPGRAGAASGAAAGHQRAGCHRSHDCPDRLSGRGWGPETHRPFIAWLTFIVI